MEQRICFFFLFIGVDLNIDRNRNHNNYGKDFAVGFYGVHDYIHGPTQPVTTVDSGLIR